MAQLQNNNITFIKNILQKNESIRIQEYTLLGITIDDFVLQTKKESPYQEKQLLGNYQGSMKQFSYELNKKKNLKQVDTEHLNNEEVDIINDSNVFNVVKEKTEYIDWKQLDNTIKKEKVKNYLDINIDYYYLDESSYESLYNELCVLIDEKTINYKKYIEYDKVNERIINMPVLVVDKSEQKTIINISDTKKIKKSNKFFK